MAAVNFKKAHLAGSAVIALLAVAAIWWIFPSRDSQAHLPRKADDIPRIGQREPDPAEAPVIPHQHQHSMGNLDVREPDVASADREARRSTASRELQAKVPGVRIDYDEITGGPKHIMAVGGFLTSAVDGEVTGARAQEIVAGFIDANRSLFGHGSTTLDDGNSRISRDDLSSHNGMRTVVWQQELDGIPFFQTILRASITQNGELITVGGNFLSDAPEATGLEKSSRATLIANPPLAATRAVVLAAADVDTTVDENAIKAVGASQGIEKRQEFQAPEISDTRTSLAWVAMGPDSARLAWDVVLMSTHHGEMFRVLVDVESGDILVRQSLTEAISDATYRVYAKSGDGQPHDSPTPMSPGHPTPLITQPAAVSRELITIDALNTTASPNGWINDGVTQTLGNNVDAHTDFDASPNVPDLPRPTSATRTFDFPMNFGGAPNTYAAASVTQLFYVTNWLHDRLYEFGFTESAGNFQTDNFGRGGFGNDAVLADAQDGSGTNNANFSTPPDGSPGRMQMFVFTGPTPDIDGDLDTEIVIHEYVHGLSNRLVGGGVGMSATQSRSMGEGWSDFYGMALLSEPTDNIHGNYPAGGYATRQFSGLTTNYYFGIRRYPYSTNLAVNPLTFKDIDPNQASSHTGIQRSPIIGNTANEVHNAGEVWCVALWEMRANLITRYGFQAGNDLTLQLVTDGMKLSPPNPNFLQARDAIIQADLVNNAGANQSELWNAFAKRGMGASATSPSSATTNGLNEAYDTPDAMSVAPFGEFAASGQIGGAISPSSQTFTVHNSGTASINWTASKTQPWLNLSVYGGSLAPGAQALVNVTFTSAASALASGDYQDVVTFRNLTSGATTQRAVQLTIEPFYIPIFAETFEAGALGSAWTLSGTATHRTLVTTASDPHQGAFHLTMDSSTDLSYSRNEATLTLNLAGRQDVVLNFWVKMFNDEGDPPPTNPFTTGADFDGVAVSNDGGVTWYEIRELRSISNLWQRISVDLDASLAAHGLTYTSNFKIRFNHYDNYGISTDGFAFDDILVAEALDKSLTITAPDFANEGDAPISATLSVTPAPSSALTVYLASNSPDATVSASVVVPAGSSSVNFMISPVDDDLIDGSQTAVITASAATYPSGSRAITVDDNETATLALDIPDSVIEGSSPPTGLVTVDTPVDSDVAVTITSDSPSVKPPTSVVIPAGSVSALFSLVLVDDNQINGDRPVAVTATVANWTPAADTMVILDDETRELRLTLPDMREGDSGKQAKVEIPGTLSSDLTVNLACDDTTELTVPATATILAGTTFAWLPLVIEDDVDPDGTQPVNVTATATGFTAASAAGNVDDNDAHHFAVTAITGPVLRGAPVSVTVTALDVNDAVITNYAQTIQFSAINGSAAMVPLSPADAGGFANGELTLDVTFEAFGTGVVLTAGDSGGHVGQTNAFDIVRGPFARFAWDEVPTAQSVDSPFPVTLRAVDAAGNTVLTYLATADLSVVADQGVDEITFPVSPAVTGSFTNGEWTGTISVPVAAGNLRLRATNGSGEGDSNAFDVITQQLPFSGFFSEDFESGSLNPEFWTSTGTGNFRTQVTSSYSPHGGTMHMAMDSTSSSARNEATLTLDLAGHSGVTLGFWAAGYGDEPNGPPPSPFTGGADFDGVAISADGSTWWEIQGLRSLPSTYGNFTVDLDAAIAAVGISYTPEFKIRFNQYDNSSLTTDGIVIDDIVVNSTTIPGDLTLNLPAQATEGDGPVNGSLVLSAPASSDLTVTLVSKSPSKVSVPSTVTISAGSTSTTLPLNILDDAFVDGPKNVILSAVATGQPEVLAAIRILDNDGGTLTLAVPPSARESDGSVTATISLSTPSLIPLEIDLTSDLPQVAQAPATVTLPAGVTSVPFTITILDDPLIDGDQQVRFTATADGWSQATADLTVRDDESRDLALSIPASLRETDGPKIASVSLGGIVMSDVIVTLTSSDTTEATVPASVIIAAGQSSAVFLISAQNDDLADGDQPFTISASAPGSSAAQAIGTVRDNEAHHFTFSPIGSSQLKNGPIPVIVTARDGNGDVAKDCSATILLSAYSDYGPLAVSPSSGSGFVNGVWSGFVQIDAIATHVVLTAEDGSGHVGSSNAFDLVAGSLDHFEWSPVPAMQTVDTPFAVTIRAANASGATVAGYGGIANLFVRAASLDPVIGSAGSSSSNLLQTYYHDSRSTTLYTAAEVGGAARITSLAFNVTSLGATQTLNNFTIRMKHSSIQSPSTTSWDNTGWTTVYRASPTISTTGWVTYTLSTPFDYDGTNNLLLDVSMDRSASTSYYTYFQSTTTSPYRSVYGYGNSLNGDPLTWTTAPYIYSTTSRADIRFTTVKDHPVRPVRSGAFTDGVWTGEVSVPFSGNMSLLARAGGVSGTSNTINVMPAVTPPNGGATVFSEDFEGGSLNPSYWTTTGTGNFRTQVTSSYSPHGGTRHMTMDTSSGAARNEPTLTLNLAGRTGVRLKFWAVEYSDEANGPPTSPFTGGADFDGVAISADGNTWWEVQSLRSLTSTYEEFTLDLDGIVASLGISYSPAFKIRFNQYDDTSLTSDGIGIDDILVTADPISNFTLAAPSQVTEGDAPATATVTLASIAASDTVVMLASTAPAKLAAPASVTVPAGQLSASFQITMPDDDLTDGNRSAYLSGTVAGSLPRGTWVTVVDDDTLPLKIVASNTFSEGDSAQTGTLKLASPASVAITVNLSSSDTSAITVPTSVTFLPGQSSVGFTLTVINDTLIDGTQIATISANVPGWPGDSLAIQVIDNESRSLAASQTSSIVEGSSTTGTVSLTGKLGYDLIVSLSSSNPARLTVPATLTIPAGATSASYSIVTPDNTTTDGSQSISVNVSAPTFTSILASTTVTDNDVHHFSFASISTTKQLGIPFNCYLYARDIGNATISSYSGPVSLTAIGSGGPVPLSPSGSVNLSSGSWSGQVACLAADGNVRFVATAGGVTGTSNTFQVLPAPKIAVAPQAVSLTLNQGASAIRSLAVSNIGSGTLTWSAYSDPLVNALPLGEAAVPPDESGIPTASAVPPSLASVRASLNANGPAIIAAIPNRYSFTDGVTGTYISDGGNDMYDYGNYLGTNLGSSIPYSDNVILSSAALGTGGAYFTRKLEGLFVFAADVAGLSYFEITGGLGADGYGSTDTAILSQIRDGTTYRGFVKRVYGVSGEPSVNHLIIVADNGLATHEATTDTDNDYHRLSGLAGVTRIYDLLYAGTSGAYIDNGSTLDIMSQFLDSVTGTTAVPPWLGITPSSGSLVAGDLQNLILTIDSANLTAGSHTGSVVFSSNDPLSPQVSVPVSLTVTNNGNLSVSPATLFTASGSRGGSFSPASRTYTLTNNGGTPLDWMVAATATWLVPVPAGGTLAPGASTTVTASIAPEAAGLPSGTANAVLNFTNTSYGLGTTSRPVSLTIIPAGEMAVTPSEPFATGGTVGTPFVPQSRNYVITNSGDAPTAWVANHFEPWLSLSQSSGTVTAGASQTITATVNASIAVPGHFADTLSFVNVTNGRGNSDHEVRLALSPSVPQFLPEPTYSPGTSNTIIWNSVPNADSYEIQAATDSDFATPVATAVVAGNSHAFTGLLDGTFYLYRVRAIADFPEGALSSPWSPLVGSIQDSSPPVLIRNTPLTTSQAILSPQGFALDTGAGVGTILVNGVPVPTTSGIVAWTARPVLLTPGDNVIAVTGSDVLAPPNSRTELWTVTYTGDSTIDADGDSLPDEWEIANGLDPVDDGSFDPRQGLHGDPDGDTLINLLEYAFGLDPLEPDLSDLPASGLQTNLSDGKQYLEFRFRRRIQRPDVHYLVETNADPTAAAWESGGTDVVEISNAATGDGVTEICTMRVMPSTETANRKFVRLKVTVD